MRRVVAIAAIALAGCATGPTGPALTADGRVATLADAGQRPLNINADSLREMLRLKQFLDPDGAKIDGIVGPTFVNVESEPGFPGFYGWGVCFDVNPKNAYGDYVGYRRVLLVVRAGVEDAVFVVEDPNWTWQSRRTRAACDRIAEGKSLRTP
jgi:hypothetical protein